jgi:hypothetical protein
MSVVKGTLEIKTEVIILLKFCPLLLIEGVDIHQVQGDVGYVW